MAAQPTAAQPVRPYSRGVTPEIYFAKSIDNSRLVRIADPRRQREMGFFGCVMTLLFVMVMLYAWQHFRAIEYGYRVESLRMQRDNLIEVNRALKLEQASLRDPGRIDVLARRMGLAAPEAGQVIRIDNPGQDSDSGAVLARVSVIPPAAVVAAAQ